MLQATEQAPLSIDICRLESCSAPDLERIIFRHPDPAATTLVQQATLKVEGAYIPRGPAPQGAMEDELSDWIHALSLKLK